MEWIIYTVITGIVGIAVGYIGRHYVALLNRNSIENKLEERILSSKREAKKIEEEALKFSEEIKQRLDKTEARLDKKEDELESREEAVKLSRTLVGAARKCGSTSLFS
jgi:vacuolar-type H+-ATPase subunit I/STV1